MAEAEVKGIPGAVWRRAASMEKGWEFIADYQEQQLLAPPIIPDPVNTDPLPAVTTSLQSAVQHLNAPCEPASGSSNKFSGMRGQVAGPDPSQNNEGKIFNMFLLKRTLSA